jgi:hypothetical protein
MCALTYALSFKLALTLATQVAALAAELAHWRRTAKKATKYRYNIKRNCSCGRAEADAAGAKPKLTQAMLDDPQTNCGSCSLGDAFRCGGCPYRGLPAFEPGKKITLPEDFLMADT